MTTPLYPIFEKRISDAFDKLTNTQIEPWAMFNSGHPIKVARFDGRKISYEGIGFEGSPQLVFWSRYIEPFLEDISIQQITDAAKLAREREVDGRLLLGEIEGLLLASCRKTFTRMSQIEQRLMGKGFPEKIPMRSTQNEYEYMKEFVEKHIRAELEMWKTKRWYEIWYEKNKFWVWVIGLIIAISSIVIKLH